MGVLKSRLLALVFVYTLALLTLRTEAKHVLEVQVLSYHNPLNRDSNGQPCDFFDPTCDSTFLFCLSERGYTNCNLGTANTAQHYIEASSYTFTPGQDLIPGSGVSNPVQFPERFPDLPWLGGFNLRVYVSDYDNPNFFDPNDPIDVIEDDRALAPSTSFTPLITITGLGARVTMTFKYRVMCKENYYRADCTTHCIPRNDNSGHYRCDSNGDIMCLDGYRDEATNCIIHECDPSCVNGQCTGPNTCICSSGWTGPVCDLCRLAPDCPADRATCAMPGECTCIQGYSGTLCQNDDDVCSHMSPCAFGATCDNDGPNIYTCSCTPGYTGVNCDVEIDGCDPASPPCKNQGTCLRTDPGQFACTCAPGWTGVTCGDDIDECVPTPPCVRGTCHNCVSTGPTFLSDPLNPDSILCLDGFICDCPEGYFGDTCETEVDYCDPSPCINGGVCHDVIGGPGYSCICPSGYTGINCDVEINECDSMPCHNEGECTSQPGSYNCSCLPGFRGHNCQIDIDECQNSSCSRTNTRVCIDGPNSYECVCASGYTGQFCDVEVDYCVPNHCLNGVCTNLLNDFLCDCYTGFTGAECDVDIDFCINPEVCLNNGTCVDGVETYTCQCSPTFTGQQCESPFNPCQRSPCSIGKGCVENPSSTLGYDCEDCSLLQEGQGLTFPSGCGPSIVDPDTLHGNTTAAPVNAALVGGVIGGTVAGIIVLSLLICLIVCCVRFCPCCCVRTKADTDHEAWTDNGVQANPLYFEPNTLLSSHQGTLPTTYGSTRPHVNSPTRSSNPVYETLPHSSESSMTDSADRGPMQNPMCGIAQATIERIPQPPPPRKGSTQNESLTKKVSFLTQPVSLSKSSNHYETIPAHKTDKPVLTVKSGTYDSLTNEPTPMSDPLIANSGKYDSLSPSHDPPIAKSGKYDSLSALPETVGNPYVLSPQHENPPDLVMAPSDRGDMYVMLPPMSAFASLKEMKSEKKNETDLPKYDTPKVTENPFANI